MVKYFFIAKKEKKLQVGNQPEQRQTVHQLSHFQKLLSCFLMDGQKMAVAMSDLAAEKDRNLELYSYEFGYSMDSPSLQQEEASFNRH